MNGLAAYRPVKRYDSGGSISGDIGSVGGLNAPFASFGPFSITPMDVVSMAVPAVAPVNMALNAFQALSNMTQQQQEAAPVEEASVNTIADVAVSPVANPTAPVETAIAPATMGLAAMNAAEQAQAEAESQAAPDSIADAIASIASDPAAAAAAAAAVSEATGVANDAQAAADGMGGDSGGGAEGTAGVGDEGGHSADGNNSGDSGDGGDGGDGGGDGDGGWYRGGQVNRYYNGGLASYGNYMNRANMMNEIRYQGGGMTPVAQAVADQGRRGDSMMVHMNPMEVAGLQALARSQGTSMTVNPQTGMPEAFNLGAFLPTLLGLGLSAATGGAATPLIAGLSNPVAIGLGTGALTAAATGSLKKGLMAGLGAYGGAGLGEGLVTTATPTTPPGMEGALGSGATMPPATPTLPGAEAYQSPFGAGTLTGSAPNYGLTGGTPPAAMGTDALGGGLNIPKTTGFNPNLTAPLPPEQSLQMTAQQGAAALPGPTPGPFANMSGKDMLKYGSAAYSGASALSQPEYGAPQSNAFLRPYKYSFNPRSGAYERTPGDTSEQMYGDSTFTPGPVTRAAEGGLMGMATMMAGGGLAAFKQGGKTKRPDSRPLTGAAPYDFMGRDETMLQSVEKNFAKGGRFLVGDGDGMSDDIPAMIADKQPARLADGEFVIPADVVSHLGNGSSKAGAERLHDMMRKIRKERTGREKQAPAVKAEKFMPA